MTKAFSVAVERRAQTEKEEELYEFTFSDEPDHPLYAYAPDEGQILVLMGLADESPDMFSIGMAQKALMGMFPEDTRKHIMRRLADRSLQLESLLDIFERLVEVTGGRPTESSPASSPSRATAGKSSTGKPRRKASTPSASR